MPYVDPYWDEYKEKMESKVKQLEADLKIWKNQNLLEQCNRQADEIERLCQSNKALTEALTDRLETNAKMEDVMSDCRDFLGEQSEAEHDGERWIPNDAMALCSRIDDLFGGVIKS